MRTRILGMAFLGLWLAAAPAGRAGVYNLAEPPSRSVMIRAPSQQVARPDSSEEIWKRLLELRTIVQANPDPAKDSPLRKDYLGQADDLGQRLRDGVLSLPDRISMSGCLLRLGKTDQARTILEEGLRQARPDEPGRFLLLLNLAAAYQETDELLPRAVDAQRQALAAWPDAWPGWSRDEWQWYYRVEKYTLILLQARQREVLQGGGRPGGFQTVYPLFPRVRFVGKSGEYEAGGIALASWEELPADAEPIVLQMLLWRPHDPRLLWLYGELLNARGQIIPAFQVLDYLGQLGLSSIQELRNHRAVLRYAKPFEQLLQRPEAREVLLWWLAPRGLPTPAGVGAALNELAWPATVQPTTEVVSPAPEVPQAALPEGRTLLVGFLGGVLATLLVGFQVGQWRRWRQRTAWSPPEPSPASDGQPSVHVTRQPRT
jgi:hypothetical protein